MALEDKIWITAHSRMYAEKRLRRYDLWSHLFLSIMSGLMIFASVFSELLTKEVAHFHAITIALSLSLFAVAMITYGSRFSDRAGQHRECYLKLQSLEENFDNTPDAPEKYQDIRSSYPNHNDSDYEDFVLSRTLFDSKTIENGGEEVKWNRTMVARWFIRRLVFWTLVLAPPGGAIALLA